MHYHQIPHVRNITGLHRNYKHKHQIKAIKDCFITWKMIKITTLFARSFRRRFSAYHYAVNHSHTNIIISLFSIPLVLKCAAKILKIDLQIKI